MTHGFDITSRLENGRGRTGVITTPHGQIQTPAFIPVGTKGTVKSVLPESVRDLGAQAILSNAYHLYLQPGTEIIDSAGGLGAFMNWPLPTFTDSGGFQVLSLGVGFKKVLSMDSTNTVESDVIAPGKDRLAHAGKNGSPSYKEHFIEGITRGGNVAERKRNGEGWAFGSQSTQSNEEVPPITSQI